MLFAGHLVMPQLSPVMRMSPVSGLLLSLSVTLGGVWLVLNQMAIRRGEFRTVAARGFLQPLVMLVVQGIWAVSGLTGPGLVVGYVAGQVAATVPYLASARSSLTLGASRAWRTIVAHRSFITIMTPQGVLNVLNVQLPILIVSLLFDVETTGLFSMAQRVLGLPVGLIGTAMGQVYVSYLSASAASPQQVWRLFQQVSRALTLVAIVLVVGIGVAGPWAFKLVLGEQWVASGEYSRLLVVMYAAQLVAAPLSTTLIVARKEGQQALWDVGRFVALLMCYAAGHYLLLAPRSLAALLSWTLAAAYIGLWALSRRSVALPPSVRSARH